MKKTRMIRIVILIVVLVTGGTSAASDTHIAVIVAPNFRQSLIESGDVARIFRRRLRVANDGTQIVPVNLPIDDPLRVAFSLSLFDVEPNEMESYWNERYFHGISPPHVVASSEAMLRFVATTPGAIGYVRDCERDERVAVLFTFAVKEIEDTPKSCPQDAVGELPDLQTKFAQ